jgi:hypothetical protein
MLKRDKKNDQGKGSGKARVGGGGEGREGVLVFGVVDMDMVGCSLELALMALPVAGPVAWWP